MIPKSLSRAILHLWIKFTEWKVLFQTSSTGEINKDRVRQFLKKVQSIPPWSEWQVEVLAQVEDVEWQPAHNEEQQGGQQQVGPPHIAPFTQQPSAQDTQGYRGDRGFKKNWQARVQVPSTMSKLRQAQSQTSFTSTNAKLRKCLRFDALLTRG